MFYVKKWITAFSYPYALGLLLMGVGFLFLFRRRERPARMLLLTGFLLVLLPGLDGVTKIAKHGLERDLITYGTTTFLERYPDAREPMPVVVLGGGVMQGEGLALSSKIPAHALARVVEAVRVARDVPDRQLIVSGGKPYGNEAEAEPMAQLAEEMGVPRAQIVLEANSRDTAEQAVLVKKLLTRPRFLLVTTATHMPRSMMLFRQQGLDPIPCPSGLSPDWEWSWNPSNLLPSAKTAGSFEIVFHEYLGILVAWLRGG